VLKLKQFFQYFLMANLVLILSSCSVELVSPYNSALMKSLNTVQKQTNVILLGVKQNINAPKANYKNYASKYVRIEAEMADIISNAKAIPNNQVTTKQIAILQHSLAEMKQMHQRGFKSVKVVNLIQKTLNDDFTAVYRLQYVKQHYLPK